jgi:hypothetical protein
MNLRLSSTFLVNPVTSLIPFTGERKMALYKYQVFLEKSEDEAFDQLIVPGTAAPWPGIYRCHACGHEIATAATHALPPQNHHQHKPGVGPIQWRLVMSHKAY